MSVAHNGSVDFYGAPDDFIAIVDFIFDQPGWVLVELASRHDLPLRRFSSTSEVREAIDLNAEDCHFLLYAPSMGASIGEHQIKFRPGAVPGAVGRTEACGWGLIQVYLMSPRAGRIRPSHLGGNSETRARRWEPTSLHDLGPAAAWDWREVERVSSRLIRFVQRLGVGKEGSRAILPGAAAVLASGGTLALNA